jgi:thymidine phosphorylase
MAARDIGLAVVAMGGGRVKAADGVDHAVGLTGLVSLGQSVAKGEPLAMIHARDEGTAQMAEQRLRAAIAVGHDPAEATLASIIERVSA